MTHREPHLLHRTHVLVVPLALLTSTLSPSPAEPSRQKHKLHEPAEIMKLMEGSVLTYELGIDDDLPPRRIESLRVLSDQMLLIEKDGGYRLTRYELSDEARKALDSAEAAYEKKEYEAALAGYAKLQETAPDYGHVQALIGDVYYATGNYDKARSAFEEAISRNFADYQAHWFLADTQWKLGDRPRAIRTLTTAHLLNVNHKAMRDRLLDYRIKADRPWKDWTYEPRYSITKDGDKIKVAFAREWLGYAIVKAVWAFEPGYAFEMAGPDYEKNVITMPEEQEALAAEIAANDQMKHLLKIVEDGYGNELLYYELLARRAPEAIVLMPRDTFMRIVDYVDTYH